MEKLAHATVPLKVSFQLKSLHTYSSRISQKRECENFVPSKTHTVFSTNNLNSRNLSSSRTFRVTQPHKNILHILAFCSSLPMNRRYTDNVYMAKSNIHAIYLNKKTKNRDFLGTLNLDLKQSTVLIVQCAYRMFSR
jgi:hypothetical protein